MTGPAGGQVEVPERPIASARAQNQDLVLEVFRLARTSPRAVTLVFAVRNRGSEPISMLDFDLRSPEGDGDYIDGVSLFDPANLKQHLVYLDAQGRCLCSTYEFTQDYQPGRLRYFSAQFPAPPAGVREMTVITPIGSVANVPISQG